MIQQQTRVDIADNTGAKTAMCIKVLGGSTARGKFTRKVAGVGDLIVVAVKTATPNGDVKLHEVAKAADPPPGRQLRAVRPQRGGDRGCRRQSPRHAYFRRGGP